ncbi:MAG: geranyl-CoA carboxylase alpha subunit [Gammaproteobacteria bacterium]|jgi:geranyl-CoA carboxylase alpha subunit
MSATTARPKTFTTIVIANRGEIAVRIARTARAHGYRTVAVYSDADRGAPHVEATDCAVHLGPSPASESYLNGERVLAAARDAGADAIHPGYGFLSENADFAQACRDAGLVFIGPPTEAIRLMGNKAQAKRRMLAAGVPCVPGYEAPEQGDDAFTEAGERIGYPIMVKAAAGGGGRGMRLVTSAGELTHALGAARTEAQAAFGSGELILERALTRPRHVEVQVFADALGAVIHLGERDCSIQRRHQKVIEEAPCPVMTPTLRAEMGQAAVEAARAIGYEGAGTVEFLLDTNGQFYFLEMNTRLQVEHPVTEAITGLDLVAMQLDIAAGRALSLTQESVQLNGHAIEARLYAEDPANSFVPAAGTIAAWAPGQGTGIRIDSGIRQGTNVSAFYDPMLAKIIAHGPDRESARRRLLRALEASLIAGLRTNRAFLCACLRAPDFCSGDATTAFIEESLPPGALAGLELGQADAIAVAALWYAWEMDVALGHSLGVHPELLGWSNAQLQAVRYELECDATTLILGVTRHGTRGVYLVEGEHGTTLVGIEHRDDHSATIDIDGLAREVRYIVDSRQHFHLATDQGDYHIVNRLAARSSDLDTQDHDGSTVRSPMHGKVLEVCVQPGDAVDIGSRLVVIEAMKMQHEITASTVGTVRSVHCQNETQVSANALLFEIEPAGAAGPE